MKKSAAVFFSLAGIILNLVLPLRAQTFTPLHSFGGPDGNSPLGTLTASNNRLFGTTAFGGAYGNGNIFSINPDGTGYTNLYDFSESSYSASLEQSTNGDGSSPQASLLLSGNILYGTTSAGGVAGFGSVFSIRTDGTGFVNLHSFAPGEGDSPTAGLTLSGNRLYGTTFGLDSGFSTIFSLDSNGSNFSNLYTFSATAGVYPALTNIDGAEVMAGLVVINGNIYGVASAGGKFGYGTLFTLRTNGTGFADLYDFSTTTGSTPTATLVLAGNVLIGSTSSGGSSSNGILFAYRFDGTGLTNLHVFSALTNQTNSDGANPNAGLASVNGILYGTAQFGGLAGQGTIFQINPDGSGFKTLYSFSDSNAGSDIFPGVAILNDTLFGATPGGGGSEDGLIYSVSLHPSFFNGETALNNGVYYLTSPNTNVFGFYTYAFFPYLYHYDLGFEYFFDASDAGHSAFFYDFTSGHFWYTNPSQFPFIYDFGLNAWLYYYPDSHNPGHYTTNPRAFYNFATSRAFTQ